MTVTEPAGLAELRRSTRATWATGNVPEVARRGPWEVGARIVQRVGIGRGERVLDVACGSGNAALRAAQAGGRVVGLDLTPERLDAGRALATAAGVEIDWVEGDAEDLPFPDESFDVVLSTFGVMFAPRHVVAATELARVLRPGGRLGLCNWTPEGAQGTFLRALGGYAPPLPPFARPPLSWGTEQHVLDLFARTGVQLEFERGAVDYDKFDTGADAVDFLATNFGPLIRLRAALEPAGTSADVRARLASIHDRHERAEYLVVLGRKRV